MNFNVRRFEVSIYNLRNSWKLSTVWMVQFVLQILKINIYIYSSSISIMLLSQWIQTSSKGQ